MRLLVLEPHASGHHASYLRWLMQAAKRKQWSVAVATTETALSHPALSSISSQFDHVTLCAPVHSHSVDGGADSSSHLLRREFAYWKSFRRAVRDTTAAVPVDAVVLPYTDYCFYALAILGAPFKGVPWCGISMRLSMAGVDEPTRLRVPWKWRMAKRILAQPNLKALYVINPSIRDVPADWCSAAQLSRLRYLADPAEHHGGNSRRESRLALGLSPTAIAVLVFGSIDERKGIDALVGAIAATDDLKDYVVILAGKRLPQSSVRTDLPPYTELQSNNQLIVLDKYLNESEQSGVFSAADVVWVGYRNHQYMSGVLVLAGRAGLPVIGTNEGEIGRLITQHEMGVAARIDQLDDVTRALRAVSGAAARMEMGQRAQSAFEGHTVESFGDEVLSVFD